ncbi:hypothetical protein ABZX40_40510 [Streptomyces sp. NPDC004610]|uniref:hypothetical protein n=1 Tax=unclassified Streptomyces TaxID=2593676 RepID=UPI0033BA7864
MSAEHLPPATPQDDQMERPHLEVVAEPGRATALLAELRLYLPTRAQLRTPFAGVGAGTRVLVGQGIGWVRQDGWIWEGVTRAGGVCVGAYYGLPAIWTAISGITGPYTPFVPTIAAVCGCVVAKRYAPATGNPQQKAEAPKIAKTDPMVEDECQDDDEPEQAGGHAPEEIAVEDVVRLVREVAARNQHSGAHLDDLLSEPLFEGWEKADLKAQLTDRWSIHVENFKLFFDGRQRNRDGVRLRHLPETPAGPVGEGSARGLSLVPPQPPAGAPSSTPSGAPASAGSGPSAGAADNPSPTPRRAPSQGHG